MDVNLVSSSETKKVIYDSLSIQFHPSTFLKQFFLHITYPILIPYFIYNHGWLFLRSQAFYPGGVVVMSYTS
jgi:hypothetical protein